MIKKYNLQIIYKIKLIFLNTYKYPLYFQIIFQINITYLNYSVNKSFNNLSSIVISVLASIS